VIDYCIGSSAAEERGVGRLDLAEIEDLGIHYTEDAPVRVDECGITISSSPVFARAGKSRVVHDFALWVNSRNCKWKDVRDEPCR